jgi:hypothetical protein
MTPYESYAVLVLCAGDVDAIWHQLADPEANPPFPPAAAPGPNGVGYVHAGTFDALAQLRANDHIISQGANVYYGFVLRCHTACPPFAVGDFLVAVRGTMTQGEWVDDGLSILPTPAPQGFAGSVGTGFWDIYRSMTMCPLGGGPGVAAAGAIAGLIKGAAAPGNTVYLCGHSLGAALSTYLAADLQAALAGSGLRLDPYFFASPKPGTTDYVNAYQRNVTAYSLVNYALDVVPMVPPDALGWAALNPGGPTHDVHTITFPTHNAPFPPDVAQDHSPVTYALMLDPNNAVAATLR